MITAWVAAVAVVAGVGQQTWPSRSGFDIYQYSDSCGLDGFWPIAGRSDVQLSIFHDGGTPLLLVSSPDWTNRPDHEFDLRLVIDDHAYTAPALGLPSDTLRAGFSIGITDEFLDDFATGEDLIILRDDAVVAHLGLQNTATAIADLRACQRHVAREQARQAAREARVDYIARDPFATPGEPLPVASPSPTVRPPVITNPSWARQPSAMMPDRAQERGLTGSADLSCTVNPNGSLTACSIVSETPAGAGFGRAAMASVGSARLSPRSVDGVAPGGTVRFTVRFPSTAP